MALVWDVRHMRPKPTGFRRQRDAGRADTD